MNLKSRNKVEASFNMSSLTDIIFLLLIFFMLVSTLVSVNALKLLLPNSEMVVNEPNIKLSVSIDPQRKMFLSTNLKKPVTLYEIESALRAEVAKDKNFSVSLHADRSVPIEDVVNVMNIANELKIRMVLATEKSS